MVLTDEQEFRTAERYFQNFFVHFDEYVIGISLTVQLDTVSRVGNDVHAERTRKPVHYRKLYEGRSRTSAYGFTEFHYWIEILLTMFLRFTDYDAIDYNIILFTIDAA